MTDNETIKALECCIKLTTKCSECPYNEVGEMCFDLAKEDAIKLINRQRAEIERLKSDIKTQDLCVHGLYETLETARAEAIKEFAERLKKNAENQYSYDSEYDRAVCNRVVDIDDIDNLVKEMTEEAGNGKRRD